MDTAVAATVLKHLILEEGSFPAMKVVLENHIDIEEKIELPKLTPSHYYRENNMSTEERHKLLSRQQRKMDSRGLEVKIEPPIIAFQSYKFGETHRFHINVRNVSKKTQKVVLLMDESYVFTFDECSQRVAKFPCGMSISATITFAPDSATEDYFHKLIVSTNTKKVVVPIVAIGTRAILDAPDSLFLSDSPVRQWLIKPITVLNVGKRTARFSMWATGPFFLKPEKGIVAPNHAFTFDIAYFSKTVASHEGEIRIVYDNGEETFIEVKANAIDKDIKLSSPDTRSEDTYVGLNTRSTIYIQNDSNITAKFYWKRFENQKQKLAEDEENVEGKADAEENEDDVDICKCDFESQEDEMNIKETENNSGLYATCFKEIVPVERQQDEGTDDDDTFKDENFRIYPLFGEVRPQSKTAIHIVFSPTLCKFYEGTAYLDITGLEKRLPFQYYGRGLGPKFKFGFETLNVGDVALGGSHTYEIPVQNISVIPGVIQFDGLVGTSSVLGMKVEPAFLEVQPSQYNAFYVNFSCVGVVGKFEDEVKFINKDTGDTSYVTVTGSLCYPRIQFKNNDINLGNLSYGFPQKFYFPLVNESMNYVQIDLKMETDGVDPHVDFHDILESLEHTVNENFKFSGNPAEFKLSPQKFTLKPRAIQNIELTMFPNQIRTINNFVKCMITNDVGEDVEKIASIKVTGAVVVPSFTIEDSVIRLKGCYTHYPKHAELIFKNSSELPVVFCIIHKSGQKNGTLHSIKVTSQHFMGVADPWIETKVPFEVVTSVPGESYTSLELHAIGCEETLQTFTIKCDSILSKVEASVKGIDWGKVDIMFDKSVTFEVINTSPLPLEFHAIPTFDRKNEKGEDWKVTPEEGVFPPKSRTTFTVQLYLRQIGYYFASIRIPISGPLANHIDVKMKALGTGTPLVFDSAMEKVINFGTIFVKTDASLNYLVTNKGIHPQVLEWKPHGDKPPTNRLGGSKQQIGQKKAQQNPSTISVDGERRHKGAFSFVPRKVTVQPGATVTLTILAYSLTAKSDEELWSLWTYVPANYKSPVVEEEKIKGDKTIYKGYVGSASASIPLSDQKNFQDSLGEHRSSRNVEKFQNLHQKPTVLRDVKLTASFEAAGVRFSKKSVNFVIEANPNQNDFFYEQIIKIENSGTLPIKVKLKTKFPFMLQFQGNEMPKEEASGFVEKASSTTVRVQFDGSHLRKERGVIKFTGKLEATVEGSQGLESIDLRAIVRFPQLILDRHEIDFGQISNGQEAVEQITVTNPCNSCLTYKWYIQKGSTVFNSDPKPFVSKEFISEKYRPSLNNNSLMPFASDDDSRAQSKASNAYLPSEVGVTKSIRSFYRDNVHHSLGLRSTPINRVSVTLGNENAILEHMYRTRMMEFMGLRDAEYEAEDEVNYLAYYNQNLLPIFIRDEERNINEYVDVIPLAGLVQAGQSQTFTFVFYGHSDIDFKTQLVLYVEGGVRKIVNVKGSTIPSKVDRPYSGKTGSSF